MARASPLTRQSSSASQGKVPKGSGAKGAGDAALAGFVGSDITGEYPKGQDGGLVLGCTPVMGASLPPSSASSSTSSSSSSASSSTSSSSSSKSSAKSPSSPRSSSSSVSCHRNRQIGRASCRERVE